MNGSLVFTFVSERAAVDFIQFIGNEYELELELNAMLHIEVSDEDFESEEARLKLFDEVERYGGHVLL